MYSPKIKEDLIPKIYQVAKEKGLPMTKLIDEILRDALNRRLNKKKGKEK